MLNKSLAKQFGVASLMNLPSTSPALHWQQLLSLTQHARIDQKKNNMQKKRKAKL